MRNPSGHQGENEWKKVNNNRYDISSTKRVTRKFLEISRCGRSKQRQSMNVQKSVLHVQSCFFAKQTYCCFFTILVAFAAQHNMILYFLRENYKNYRELPSQPWLNLYIRDILAAQLTDTLTGQRRFFSVQYQELYHLSLH